jgi:hypothetical protein
MLDAYSTKDPRIKVIHQNNQGLTKSLINGCNLAQGEFIARQDVGDISFPERFNTQLQLLKKNPKLGMVYSGADFYGPFGELLFNITRSNDPDIAHQEVLNLKLGPCHSSVIMQKSTYHQAGGYRPQFYYSQDADLWLRIAQISKVCSTPQTLIQMHIDLYGISASKKVIQYQFADLAHAAKDLRMQGKSDQPILGQAQALIQKMLSDQNSKIIKQKKQSRDLAAHLYYLGALSSKKHPRESFKYFSLALKNDPLNFKYWIKWFLSSLSFS